MISKISVCVKIRIYQVSKIPTGLILRNKYKREKRYCYMSGNQDWRNNNAEMAETEMNGRNTEINQDNSNEPMHFIGNDQSEYEKQEMEIQEPSPLKIIFSNIMIIAVSWFITAGFINNIRYLQILGLSILALVVLSLIISIFRPGRVNFWAIWYLGDLIDLLVYLIALIIRIAIEIFSKK
ncbi:MAG: hypothetical protein ACTSXK_03730 [Promethearchaeota archaeon]